MRLAPALLLVVAAASPCAMADLVTNGGFETGTTSSWTTFGSGGAYAVYDPANIGESNTTYGSFILQVASPGTAVGIRQTLNASAGDQLQISFHLGNRSASTPNSFYASLGGVNFESLAGEPAFRPRLYSYTVAVTADNPVLEFGFLHPQGNWVIDNISAVNLVPLPAGAWIGLAGLAGVGAVARRRKR